jgi:DNA-binding MarR family transcriptional regulator
VQQDRNLGRAHLKKSTLTDTAAALEQRLSIEDDYSSNLPCDSNAGEVTLTLGADEARALRRILTSVAQRDLGLDDGTSADRAMLMAEMMCDIRDARGALFPASMFSEPAWDILLALYVTDGEPAASDLARRTHIPSSTLWRWLAYLEGHNLIEREDSPDDKRAHKIRLTDEARANLRTLFEGIADRYNPLSWGTRVTP